MHESIQQFRSHDSLDAMADAFERDGFVLLRQLISPAELNVLQADTSRMIRSDRASQLPASDYFHALDSATGREVFHRVQYVFPKAADASLVRLLGHPRMLQIVRRLIGDDLFCAAEALVFKLPGNGREVSVHADCDPAHPRLAPVIFNVDFYLDDSTIDNGCLLVAPGSHKQNLPIGQITNAGFNFPGLTPVEVRAGDVIIHNIRVVHGSHRSIAPKLRRTLYYEFHSLAALVKQGGPRPSHPLKRQWIADRVRIMRHAIADRQRAPYANGEIPFDYLPPPHISLAGPVNLRPALGIDQYF